MSVQIEGSEPIPKFPQFFLCFSPRNREILGEVRWKCVEIKLNLDRKMQIARNTRARLKLIDVPSCIVPMSLDGADAHRRALCSAAHLIRVARIKLSGLWLSDPSRYFLSPAWLSVNNPSVPSDLLPTLLPRRVHSPPRSKRCASQFPSWYSREARFSVSAIRKVLEAAGILDSGARKPPQAVPR